MATKQKKIGKLKDSPLWFHAASGQWCKKIKQKVVYFGKDHDAALKQWAEHKDRLLAGLPIVENRSPSITELANLYIDAIKRRAAVDGLSRTYIKTVEERLGKVISITGRNAKLQGYTIAEWENLRILLGRNRDGSESAPNTLGNRIEMVRLLCHWSNEQSYTTIKIPSTFCKPQRKVVRRFRNEKRKSLWISREDIRKLIENADVTTKPVILLGINCGLGASDIARIRHDDIDLDAKEVWLTIARQKTETIRHLYLWPETVQALREYDAVRPVLALHPKYNDRLLLTHHRRPWVDNDGDRVGPMLRRLRERAGIVSDVSHYALRRSLLTAVINLGFHERIAKQIAGHEDGGDILFQHYVGEQDRAPIKRCLLAVRDWLFEAKQ